MSDKRNDNRYPKSSRDRSRSIDRTDRAARARNSRKLMRVDDVTHTHFDELKREYGNLEKDFDSQKRKVERERKEKLEKEREIIEKDAIIGRLRRKINEKERKESEEIIDLRNQVKDLKIQITDVPVVRLDIFNNLQKDLNKQKERKEEIEKVAAMKSKQLLEKEEKIETLDQQLFKARSDLLKAKKQQKSKRQDAIRLMRAYKAYTMAISHVASDFDDEELTEIEKQLHDIWEIVEIDEKKFDGQIFKQARIKRTLSAQNLNQFEKGKMPLITNEPMPDISGVGKKKKGIIQKPNNLEADVSSVGKDLKVENDEGKEKAQQEDRDMLNVIEIEEGDDDM